MTFHDFVVENALDRWYAALRRQKPQGIPTLPRPATTVDVARRLCDDTERVKASSWSSLAGT